VNITPDVIVAVIEPSVSVRLIALNTNQSINLVK